MLVTAGPTREPIDPVRFLSNRSSGKMGYAIAAAAHRRGHAVMLISGPVALPVPDGVACTAVLTADEMHAAVMAALPGVDALIMTAAVADWTPVVTAPHKLKKHDGPMRLELKRTRDILLAVKAHRLAGQIVVGFAAETRNLAAEARRKLEEKALDLVVANDVSRTDAGFGSDMNRVLLLDRAGDTALPLQAKTDLAERILERIEALAAQRMSPPPASMKA